MKKILSVMIAALALTLALSACTKSEPGAPRGMKTASPEAASYTLYIPEEWVSDTVPGSIMTAAHVSEADRSNITMMTFENDGEYKDEKEYFATYLTSLATTFDQKEGASTLEMITDGESAIAGGKPCSRYVYTATLGGVSLKYLQVIVPIGNYFHIFTYTAYVDNFDKNLENIDAVLENIVFG